jgi:hypothetical protein
MFCVPARAAAGGSRLVWTADDALVLADARGADAAKLARWWVGHRHLRPA